MAIVNQFDKRSGITYVYESKSYRDENRQPRSKRTLIGRRNTKTGEIIPTDGRGKKRQKSVAVDGFIKTATMSRKFYGATYLFDEIGRKLGIEDDLKACFPETFKQILSIAYYLALEENSPLYRFEKWGTLHKHPYGENIPSQRSSDLFASITEDAKNRFLKLFAKRHTEKENWFYDTTSISSYAQTLNQVQYGKNKEDDKLPQVNLALVYGANSNLPFYYRKLAGNISDVSTVNRLLTDFEVLGFGKMKLVMDRGFYSEANINLLMKGRRKFLIALKISLVFVKIELDKVYDKLTTFEYYNEQYELYSTTVATEWKHTLERPYKNDTLTSQKRVYLHLYYNIDKATEDKKDFDRRLMQMRREILSGEHNQGNECSYKKYFVIKQTPKRSVQVTVNEEAVRKAKRYYGYFALLSNEKMDSITAIELYRNRDLIEKAFGNLKERLNLRRTLVSSEQGLDGKLFVAYIGLIYLSYLKKQMQVANLFKKYTMQSLIDRLDVIECFEYPGHSLKIGEVTDKQRQLYKDIGLTPPM